MKNICVKGGGCCLSIITLININTTSFGTQIINGRIVSYMCIILPGMNFRSFEILSDLTS